MGASHFFPKGFSPLKENMFLPERCRTFESNSFFAIEVFHFSQPLIFYWRGVRLLRPKYVLLERCPTIESESLSTGKLCHF